jgi:hypothetical protein
MAQRRTPDLSSSRAPVHSALVQKSVTVITNPAGRLSIWMLGKTSALGKWKSAKRWQVACNQSNVRLTNGLASDRETKGCDSGKNGVAGTPQRQWKPPIRQPRTTEGLDSVEQL